jgi:small subunit ribosomal protein S6
MKKYELLLTLPGTLDDNEVQQELEKVVSEVKNYCEGEVKINSLGKVRLAYPVKQIRYGYYYTLVFEAEPTKTPELNNKLRLNKGLLRAIINNYNPEAKDVKPIFSSQQPIKTEVKEKITLDEVMSDKNDKKVEKSTEKEVKPKKEEKPVVEKKPTSDTKKSVDLNDIDKKLDEIIDSSDIIPGV